MIISPITYSIVIPVYNEQDNIHPLVQEIEEIMNRLNHPWELIFVDDGSDDATWTQLHAIAQHKAYCKPLRLRRNFGQTAALDAGFCHAQGEWIIMLDGDGQNAPGDIPLLLAQAHQADLVCGVRTNRKDIWHKKWISRIANASRQAILEDQTVDTGCTLKLFKKSCLEKIKLYQGMHRFLPALFMIEGYTVQHVPVQHRARKHGYSKYHLFNRCIKPIVDLMAVAWMKKRHLHYEIVQEE